MTLCIAAVCRHEGQPAIVTCADWQVTGPSIAWEDYYKLRHYPNATIMISGGLGEADDVCFDLYAVLKEFDEIRRSKADFEPRVGQYIAKVRETLTRRKRLRAEHTVAMKWGISLDKFYRKGLKRMPKDLYRKVIGEIEQVGLGMSSIIVYSGGNELVMLKTGPHGGVFWERTYAAIGSGERIALAFLCQAPHDPNMPLGQCLARVLTAKVAAERDPNVGRNTSLGVILADGRRFDVGDEAWAFLRDRVRTPLGVTAADELEALPLLGKLLTEGETGQGRQTADPWAQPAG